MTYIITMTNGRQWRIDDYDDQSYNNGWLRFYNDAHNVTDRFKQDNIEHIDVQGRGRAELIGQVNNNAP